MNVLVEHFMYHFDVDYSAMLTNDYKIGISFFLSFRLEMINCHKNVLIYALSSGKFLNIRK